MQFQDTIDLHSSANICGLTYSDVASWCHGSVISSALFRTTKLPNYQITKSSTASCDTKPDQRWLAYIYGWLTSGLWPRGMKYPSNIEEDVSWRVPQRHSLQGSLDEHGGMDWRIYKRLESRRTRVHGPWLLPQYCIFRKARRISALPPRNCCN